MRMMTVNFFSLPSAATARTVARLVEASPSTTPSMEYCSVPSRPSVSRVSPGMNCIGRTPIPTKLERWVRSEILCGRTVFGDVAGGGDVVGGDAVAEGGEGAHAFEVLYGGGGIDHFIEVGRPADVSRFVVPLEEVASGGLDAAPLCVAFK